MKCKPVANAMSLTFKKSDDQKYCILNRLVIKSIFCADQNAFSPLFSFFHCFLNAVVKKCIDVKSKSNSDQFLHLLTFVHNK